MTDLSAFTIEQLQAELLRRQKPEDDTYYCSKCGIAEEDDENGILTDFRVIVSESEEGFADIQQLLCNNCSQPMMKALTDLGFKDHRHGSINFLEDLDCPGWGKCPTPTEYGMVLIQPSGPVQDFRR